MTSHRDIKKLRPSRNSRFKQGYINPKSCRKLFESQRNTPIIYRSSYERKFVYWLESSDKVKQWGSECVHITYVSPLDGKQHWYYPDYAVEMQDGTQVLVEVKPYSQTQPPAYDNEHEKARYAVNIAKWTACKKVCDMNNAKFWIITEHTINSLP